jgi:hypothetical protein
MKYLLPLILLLISNTVAWGSGRSSGNAEGGDLFSSCLIKKEAEPVVVRQDSAYIKDDSIRSILNEAFVIAPRDTFPVQVGAFKSRSNADKISQGIKNLTSIRVKVVVEDGLYKVRLTSMPETPGNIVKDTSDKVITIKTDTLTATATVTSDTLISKAIVDTVKIAVDTVALNGEIIFFGSHSPWLKRVKYFGESFALVNALIVSILISIISMITLLVVILLNRRRLEKEEKLRQYLMERYQSLIVDYLYGSATPDQFRSIASGSYSRQVLIDQMIDVSVNLKGEESKKLFGLYKHLGLDRDSLARARNFRWHKKIKGFRELAFMNIKDANDVIYRALNSSNEILRMEAQVALVRLSDEDHFEFLTHLKRPFSLWEQITLHDIIIQHNIPVPPFKKWLTSDNDTVVLFSLRMIREFKQTDAEEDIQVALHHNSEEVRRLAVQVAGDMKFVSTLEIMKKMYKNQDYKICLEIVKSMGKMPDPSMLGFLKLVLDKEDDVQLQIEATKSIEKMGEEGVKALVKIMKSEYKNYNIIVRHVLDRRIN